MYLGWKKKPNQNISRKCGNFFYQRFSERNCSASKGADKSATKPKEESATLLKPNQLLPSFPMLQIKPEPLQKIILQRQNLQLFWLWHRPISNGSSEWRIRISEVFHGLFGFQQFNNFIRIILEFAQKMQDFYGGTYEHICKSTPYRAYQEKSASSSEWQIQNGGEKFPAQHLARTYNDYSRASSRKLRLLALNLL